MTCKAFAEKLSWPIDLTLGVLFRSLFLCLFASIVLFTPAWADAKSHTVQPGESLSLIAERYKVDLDDLMALNAISDPNAIFVGQILQIPDNSTPTPTLSPTATPSPTQTPTATLTPTATQTPTPNVPQTLRRSASLNPVYTVRLANDTPEAIADRLGIDSADLLALNRMTSSLLALQIGDQLLLPATTHELYTPPWLPDSQRYMLQEGESLSQVAEKYALTVGDLLIANQLDDPSNVQAGQELLIPKRNAAGKIEPFIPQIGNGRHGFFYYQVEPADTAMRIAQMLNTNENAIIDYNGFASLDTVVLGARIRVPYGPPRLPGLLPPVQTAGSTFVVSVSRQLCWLFWGKTIVRYWHCSTGYGDYKTRLGSFRIKSKIEVAKSEAYQLDMPYWLGLYDVGDYENGIHGLPVDQWTNKKIWTELVGQPATFGCAMLGDEDAAELFRLAYLGMPVYIIQ